MDFFLKIERSCDRDLLYTSRVHPLRNFGEGVYVKREDESGFGISGPKKRKYASLLPFLQQEGIRELVLIGGSRSNHVPALLQLLSERGIAARLLLKRGHDTVPSGNALLIRLLSAPDRIAWIESADWPRVTQRAEEVAQRLPAPAYVVPEGGSCRPALPGICTLMQDIVRNEAERGAPFDHLWIDAGTGFTAAALHLMNALLKRPGQVHVVLTAGDAETFQVEIEKVALWLEELLGTAPELFSPQLYLPPTARAFGSVNATVLQETLRLAREEGLLTDPVYTTKLFMTARAHIAGGNLPGDHLIIHSGGGSGLMGFGEKMAGLSGF